MANVKEPLPAISRVSSASNRSESTAAGERLPGTRRSVQQDSAADRNAVRLENLAPLVEIHDVAPQQLVQFLVDHEFAPRHRRGDVERVRDE